jgi:hypothetical protein
MAKCECCGNELTRKLKLPVIPWEHKNNRWVRIKEKRLGGFAG